MRGENKMGRYEMDLTNQATPLREMPKCSTSCANGRGFDGFDGIFARENFAFPWKAVRVF